MNSFSGVEIDVVENGYTLKEVSYINVPTATKRYVFNSFEDMVDFLKERLAKPEANKTMTAEDMKQLAQKISKGLSDAA